MGGCKCVTIIAYTCLARALTLGGPISRTLPSPMTMTLSHAITVASRCAIVNTCHPYARHFSYEDEMRDTWACLESNLSSTGRR
jgi:hypothetical protein